MPKWREGWIEDASCVPNYLNYTSTLALCQSTKRHPLHRFNILVDHIQQPLQLKLEPTELAHELRNNSNSITSNVVPTQHDGIDGNNSAAASSETDKQDYVPQTLSCHNSAFEAEAVNKLQIPQKKQKTSNTMTATVMHAIASNPAKVLLVAATCYVISKVIYAFAFSPLRNVPGPGLARVTALRAIKNRFPKNVITSALSDFAAYGDIYVSKPDTITISNPNDVRAVLGARDSCKLDIYQGLQDPVLKNLVTFSHPQLANQRRRQISPFLTSQAYLAQMEAAILKHGAAALTEKWDAQLFKTNKIEINYRNDTQLATFNIMSALAFGRDLSSQADASIIVKWIAATAVYVGVSINFKALLQFPLSLLIKPWLGSYSEFVQFGKESVALRRDAIAAGSLKQNLPKDMLQAFLDAEEPDSKVKMTPTEVQAESVGMQLAGSETTSASLTWALHLFTLYPDVLKQATNEVRNQFDESNLQLVNYSDCRTTLPFLESFVYETFRYAPITSGFMPRVSPKGIELQGHYIPAGTKIAFNLLALNNRSDVWDSPNKFVADRFIDDEEAKKNVFAFSYGPRNCIGRNLAWMEIMTILANLLLKYDIKLPDDTVYGPKNVDDQGIPRLMESQCHIVFAPVHPDRDCRLILSHRK